MKKTDKLLIGIVVGIVLLVVVSFAVALSKPKPTYQAEDTSEGVAFNYLFALQQKDYERAYGYLSPTLPGYPRSVEKFAENIQRYSWTFSRLEDSYTTLDVESSSVAGKNVIIKIQETRFREGDLFSSSQYTYSFDITLRQDAKGQWKIVDGDRYWLACWNTVGGCK